MRRLLVAATLAAVATFAALPALADADPTSQQIYAAAEAGHLDQAQQMINQVLADHPNSGQAHYVQAELYAREGKTAQARSELSTAEQLKPGLPFANPRAVQELKAQLGQARGMMTGPTMMRSAPAPRPFPWGTVLILAGVVAILLMVFRRRNTYVQQYPGAGPGMGGAPGTYGPGGYGPAPMGGGGGIGSGIAGGLASGLAVGAGVVAGEELAHHFLDGGRSGGVISPAEASDSSSSNSDMGGSDFGLNDPGSGWGDSGGGGGDSGGGGDWS
jgi:uncharacterized protein